MAEEATPALDPTFIAETRQRAWQTGYGEGMADTIRRYNIRVIDEDPQTNVLRIVVGLALLLGCLGYLVWINASQPHNAEVPSG